MAIRSCVSQRGSLTDVDLVGLGDGGFDRGGSSALLERVGRVKGVWRKRVRDEVVIAAAR